MTKYNLEPNNENLLESLRNNIFNRNNELMDFIDILDNLEGNYIVSLDGNWGDGKTFFVKHLEIILNYMRNNAYNLKNKSDIKAVIDNSIFHGKCTKNTYRAIYYNAWLYDNHSDPMLSIIYSIIKNSDINIDTSISNGIKDKLFNVLKSINFWNLSNFASILHALEGDNLLTEIETIEHTKTHIKQIIDEIINERSDKLVIIIDELDRCRPDYAVRVLERIKHFIDDDRVIFLVAMNKSQLVHTINKFYGDNFDSTTYLNKFFDFNLKLQKIELIKHTNNLMCSETKSNVYYSGIIEDLINYENLTIRDVHLYLQQLSLIEDYITSQKDNSFIILQVVIPIIYMYRIRDLEKAAIIESGNGDGILSDLIDKLGTLKTLTSELSDIAGDDDERFQNGKALILKSYKILFTDSNETLNMPYRITINWKTKKYLKNLLK